MRAFEDAKMHSSTQEKHDQKLIAIFWGRGISKMFQDARWWFFVMVIACRLKICGNGALLFSIKVLMQRNGLWAHAKTAQRQSLMFLINMMMHYQFGERNFFIFLCLWRILQCRLELDFYSCLFYQGIKRQRKMSKLPGHAYITFFVSSL